MNRIGGGNSSNGVGGSLGGGQPQVQQIQSMNSLDPEKIIQRMRDSLAKRGNRTMRTIGRTFMDMDNNRNGTLDIQEFAVGMREHGCVLTQQECDVLEKYLDTEGNGTVNYDEFLIALRGVPSKPRQNIIDRAFKVLDKSDDGVISMEEMSKLYDVSRHPKYNGGRGKDQILEELLENFGGSNGQITKKEWDHYYAAVSASIDLDEHFIMLMKNAWKLK